MKQSISDPKFNINSNKKMDFGSTNIAEYDNLKEKDDKVKS